MFHVIRGFEKLVVKIIAVCFLVLPHFANGYSIVFVHLGDALPNYLIDAAHQARLFNSAADIIVIAQQGAIERVRHDHFEQDGIAFVACEELVSSDTHQLFLKKTSLDTTFREGFWRKCTERFYFIEELMRQQNITDVFHLEYDNMLYVDLQELLRVFHAYPNIAATFDNDDRCIPGFIYFAQAQAATKLVDYITRMCDSGLNDMQVIARYRKTYGNSEIEALPIIMPSYAHAHELKTPTGFTVESPRMYSMYFDDFESIFDAAALGQYLGGIDPRNGPSSPGFINESCVFNPSKLTFEWFVDEMNRKVPYASFEGQRCRINNLHIHSKNLKKFAS